MKLGFVGPSYTARSTAVADEECLNFYAETIETPGAQTQRAYFGTPGLSQFATFADGPVLGTCWTGSRFFVVASDTLYEVMADATTVVLYQGFNITAMAASMAYSNIQLFVVAGARAYCMNLSDNTVTDVTALLAGAPVQCAYSDGYFVVMFDQSNKYQVSAILDGNTWPGIQVNAISVFADNIVSIKVSHRELWVMGQLHSQPYQDTGSNEIFDVIPGALIEAGAVATFGAELLDNTVFWVSQDRNGARQAWRANGYTPTRVSTHAVETALASYGDISGLTSYSYQDGGHLFWCLYIPTADCTWVYDIGEQMWHKRAEWIAGIGAYGPHRSWNHAFAFGKHLVGDWKTGTLFEMRMDTYDEAGNPIRRLRRSPTLNTEMGWVNHAELTVDVMTGQGPQPPFVDGNGNPRPPIAMLRWSDDRGATWSNQHATGCGFAGKYKTRVIWRRLGRSRYRVYEFTVTDPIPWAIVDAYLRTA